MTSPQNAPTLTDFWNGNAYFERSQYATANNNGADFQELAPLVNPDGNHPNTIYTYYRLNVGTHAGIALAISTDGGATYTTYNGGNPVLCWGTGKPSATGCSASDDCVWDANGSIMPSVVRVNSEYFMVYEGDSNFDASNWALCTALGHYQTVGDVGVAFSWDGKTWTKFNGGLFLMHNQKSNWQCNNIGGPSVNYFDGQFYVFFHGSCGSPTSSQALTGCLALLLASPFCAFGVTACLPNSTNCPKAFRFDGLRNKPGMVHALGTDLTSLQSTLQSSVNSASPILDVGVGAQSWDSRVTARPNVIKEGGYCYMVYEGAEYAFLNTYNYYIKGVSEGNWGWGVARTQDINNGPWQKYPYNPIRQEFQNPAIDSDNGVKQQPYAFQINGVTFVYMWWPGHHGQSNVLVWGTDPYLHLYPSVNGGQGQCELYHKTGSVDSSHNVATGWAKSSGLFVLPDRLCYGPYQTFVPSGQYSQGIPAGSYAVTFENLIDSTFDICGGCNAIIYQDITWNTGSSGASGMQIYRRDFQAGWSYQDFEQQFAPVAYTQGSSYSYEWRTAWDANAYTRLRYVFLRELDGKSDTTAPAASLNSLPQDSSQSFTISWGGSDSQTGVWSYDVQVQDNGGAWQPVLDTTSDPNGGVCCMGTIATSFTYAGVCGHQYNFEVRARDYAGNLASSFSSPVGTTVPCNFSMTNSPNQFTQQAGGAPVTTTLTITPGNTFSGSMTLSASPPVGISASFNPPTVTPQNGNAASSNVTFMAASSVAVGSYAITITATIGQSSQTVQATDNVVLGVTYSGASFGQVGGASGRNTIVLINTPVSVFASVSSIGPISGTLSVDIREYNIWPNSDSTLTTLSAPVVLNVGTNTFQVGSFSPPFPTNSCPGCLAQYYVKAYWNGNLIYNPTDPNSREGVQVVSADFAQSSIPGPITMTVGSSMTTTINLSSRNNFAGTVDLTATANGPVMLLSPSNPSVQAGGATTSTLTITAPTSSGNYTIVVTGTSGTLVRTVTIALQVTDFSQSSVPPTINAQQGAYGTSVITLASLNGFSGTVSLTTSSPAGISLTLNATSLNLSANAIQGAYLSVSVAASVNIGNYTITVFETSGSLQHSTTIIVQVSNFSVALIPTSVSTPRGGSSSVVFTLSSINGYSGPVSLNVTSIPSCVSYGFSIQVMEIPAWGTNSSTLSLNPILGCGLSSNTITVQSSSGAQILSTSFTLTITDFTISSSPNTVNVPRGGSGSTTVNLGSLNGLAGSIHVSANNQPYYGPPPTLDGWASGFCHSTGSTQCVATLSTTKPGDLIIVFASSPTTLTNGFSIGDSANLTWSSRIFIQANYGNPFQDISVGEFFAIVPPGQTLAFDTITMTTLDPPFCCPGHNLEFVAFGVSGSNYQFDSAAGNIQPTGNPSVQFQTNGPNRMVIGYAVDGSNALTAGPGFIFITTSGNNGAEYQPVTASTSGTVSFGNAQGEWAIIADAIQPLPGFSFWFNPQNVPITAGGTASSTIIITSASFVPGGNYTLYVTGTIQYSTHIIPVTLNVANFLISSNPSTIVTGIGSKGNATITISTFGGFNGPVTLSQNNSQCSLNPSTLTGGGNSILSCTSASVASFTVTVIGTSGSESHTVGVSYTFQDFTLTANPTTVTSLNGQTLSSAISVNALNGFTGTVSLSDTISPSSGLSCWFSPSTETPSSWAYLYCSGTLGTYTVTVTGTLGAITHSTPVTWTVRDFTISVNPNFAVITDGRSATFTVQATSIGGYTGTINLTWSSASAICGTASFGKASLQPPSGGTDSTTITITMGATCSGIQYATYVAGSDNSFGVSRIAFLTLNATDFTIDGQDGVLFGVRGGTTLNYNVTYFNENNYPGRILTQSYSWGPGNCCLSTSIPTTVTMTKPDVNSAAGLVTNLNDQYQSFGEPWNGQGFYAQGRDWVFFIYYGSCSGTSTNCLYYATSTNGALWTVYNTGLVTGSYPSVVTNGTAVFYVRYNGVDTQSGQALMLGIGTLHTDGTIAWQSEKTIKPATSGFFWYSSSMRISTTGQVFVAYNKVPTNGHGTGLAYVIHSNGVDYATWQQETQLTTSSDDWRFSMVPLPNGQMYILYWPFWGGLNGELWSNGSWGNPEIVSSGGTTVQQSAFGFGVGNSTVYAIWQERTSQKILFAVRNGSWGTAQTIFTADTNLNPRWSASYDSLHNKWYIIYYSYSSNQIWEYSGDPGAWSGKTVLYSTNGATSNSEIGTFYNTGQVNTRSNTLGIFWTQYDTSNNLQLKYANATMFAGGSVTATWPITATGSGTGMTTLTVTASDGYFTRQIILTITPNDYPVEPSNDPVYMNVAGGSADFLQIFPYFGIPLTNSTFTFPPTSDPACLTVSQAVAFPKYFNIGPVIPYQYPAVALTATSTCLSNEAVTAYVTIAGATNHAYDKTVSFVVITVRNGGGGGGGSVAAGTLITLADGSQVPVQQLRVGMKLLSYDMTTHQYVVTTITKFVTVTTFSQMEIHTAKGKPLIVDQNPAQKLYVKLPDGTVTLMSVTDLKVGYQLFDAMSQTWTPIMSIQYQNGGQHLMYDIYTDGPGNYIANGYLDPLKT